jgi:hypothetical protein
LRNRIGLLFFTTRLFYDVAVIDVSGLLLAKVAAPAFAVALPPVPIIVTLVLLIHNDRPRASSMAYLFGRAIAFTTVVVAVRAVPWLHEASRRPLPQWTDWSIAAIGAVFVILGIRIWRHRSDSAIAR